MKIKKIFILIAAIIISLAPSVFATSSGSIKASVNQNEINRYTNISSEVNKEVQTFGTIQFIKIAIACICLTIAVATIIYMIKSKKKKS